MVFKLVRVDSDKSYKIKLAPGKHPIGRGSFLYCDEKRISRKHGELEISGDTIILKALHQNPCFIMKKDNGDVQMLKQDSTMTLGNGDRFGLLPASFWFEILHCITDVDSETDSKPADINNDEYNSDTDELTQNMQTQDLNDGANKTFDDENAGSPSLLSTEDTDTPIEPNNENANELEVRNEPKSPMKRTHSSTDENSDEEIKKIKTEKVEVKSEPEDANQSTDAVKTEAEDSNQSTDAEAGPSNDQPGASSNNDKVAPSPPPAQNRPRERCMYGANCYRRNPAHKAEFSHPMDPDWGPGARGQCPWGAACRRRDARHWRDHDHPPAAQQPPANRGIKRGRTGNVRKQKIVQKSSSEDEDEDDLTPVEVLGKRKRKAMMIPKDWSGSDSDDEEDPFKTDEESDDWQPDD